MLTRDQILEYKEKGYLVIPNFFTNEQGQKLIKKCQSLLSNFNPLDHPKIQFSTQDESHISDEYFLSSGDKIRYFFEENCFDDKGSLKVPKELAIHKIGHALHELDSDFKEFSFQRKIKEIIHEIGYQDPRILQSMVIFKQPRIGGAAKPHQDSTFLYTEPLSAMGFWFSLEDATPENGCLWFAPGSHVKNPLKKRFVRSKNSRGVEFEVISNATEPMDSDYVCEPTKAGTLVLLDGSVYHKSNANTSDKSRWIYTFHCIEGKAHYPTNNWLQCEVPFSRLGE